MSKFTDEQVSEAIHAAVEEKGEDYVYTDHHDICLYYLDGVPGCIVGHVFDRLGISPADVINDADVLYVGPRLGFSERQSSALQSAQISQDIGITWGRAVAAFDEALGGVNV